MTHQPRLSVIAPCYNEEDNVAVLVERMLATFDTMDVVVELLLIDDGSADATWERIVDAEALSSQVRGIRHPVNRGIEGGWASGLEVARGELVCLIDSDLQNRPEDIPRLLAAYTEHQPVMVQGVRHTKGDTTRLAFSRGLNHLLNFTFGMRLRDNKSGFILCSRDTLRRCLEHRFEYQFFQCFIGVAAGVRNVNIVEVDTDFERRHAGQSFLANVPIRVSVKIFAELLKYRAETWRLDDR